MGNHVEELSEASGKRKLELFSAKLADCESIQCETLMDILDRNANCEFGKKHKFEEIAGVDDFRREVPITHWEDYEEANERMCDGESDVLFAGRACCFIVTSGTTGREKLIQESALGKKAKDVIGDLRNAALLLKFPDLLEGKFLSLANSSAIGRTKGGIPFGMASGMTLDGTPAAILALSACPQSVKTIEDQELSDYAIMRFAVEQDVRVVTGNNPARLQTLIESAAERFDAILADIENGSLNGIERLSVEIQDELAPYLKPNPARFAELKAALEFAAPPLPALYWPNLRAVRCWLSGSIGRYLEKLRPLLSGDIQFVDGGYGASEGKFNIPFPNGESSGPLANFALFFEFVPDGGEGRGGEDEESTLLAHELQDGEKYRMIITTHSGFYRYDMRDVVRVNGFTGTTPNIEFVSKTSDIGNICGEKIYPEIIMAAFAKIAEEIGISFVHYVAVPSVDTMSYTFKVETKNPLSVADLDALAEKLDAEIAELAMGYEFLRGQNLLNPPKCMAMECGWRDSLLRAKMKPGISTSQIKLPVVAAE
ncbi:MAG: GH3 auxin-responsive promoter family protein [Victivallales bacterium]|nr:GH3 auxin-responsive promoter family protein [Victivallales bacterium]